MKSKYLIIFMGCIIGLLLAKDGKHGFGEFIREVGDKAVQVAKAEHIKDMHYDSSIDSWMLWDAKKVKRTKRQKFVKRGVKGNFKALTCRMKLGNNLCDRGIDLAWYEGGE